jgi:triacylglycerol esterase/lipase EstA (alpha/beta hydrolase family)
MSGKNSTKRGANFSHFLIPAIILAGFLFACPALAYSKVLSQTSPGCEYSYSFSGEKIFGQSFVSTSTNLVSVGFIISSPIKLSEIKICQGDFSTLYGYSNAAADWNCDHSGQRPILSFKPDPSLIFTDPLTDWTDFDFPFPIATEINKKYFILFKAADTGFCYQKYSDNYTQGEGRAVDTNIIDFTFRTYSTYDNIDWTAAVPDKIINASQDNYYSSGNSIKLNWTTPNLYNSQEDAGASAYQIKYWKKVFDCEAEYSPLTAKKQTGEYVSGPGQNSSAVIKNLDKNSSYCFSFFSSNSHNNSEGSDIVEATTNNAEYSEDLDQNNPSCSSEYNMNDTMRYGQSFITDKNNISSISLIIGNVYPAPGTVNELRLCRGMMTAPLWNDPSPDWNCDNPGQELLATTTVSASQPEWTDFHFSQPITVSPNEPLFFMIEGKRIYIRGEKYEDYYPNGEAHSGYNALDFAFRTFYSPDWIPAPPKPKLNPVILIPGLLGSWDMGSGYELDPILNTYDNLWVALKQSGYKENKTLFALPYDWRRSNSFTALLLKDKIQEVISACNSVNPADFDCDKVDLVAHSMGGLVARAYIESNDYANNVDQLIFLATPQRGAPMAYLAWEGGDAGKKNDDKILERILSLSALNNGYLSRFSYIRNLPIQSLQELLPVYDYLKDADSGNLKAYSNEYPVNDFLNNLNSQFLLSKLDNIKMTNIIGSTTDDTINYIRVKKAVSGEKWEYGKPENYGNEKTDQGLEYGEGDGTVPKFSNHNFYNSTEIFINNAEHRQIVTDAQRDVIKELTGKSPEKEIRENIFSKFLIIRIFSPADFVVIAPDNKRLGKDFVNNQNINEINGAFYSGFNTDTEFAVIPDPLDGEYKVELQGTGLGEYKLSVSGIDEATSTDKDFTGQITTGAIQNFSIDYSSSSPDLLADLKPQDLTPPNLTIDSPLEGASYKHGDKMKINFAVSDDFSGVSSTVMEIDDKIISTTTVNLFDYQIGAHILAIIAHDKAGNYAEKKINFKIITDIKSTIADIDEAYKRGWLKNSLQKNILIAELKILDGELSLADKGKGDLIKQIIEIQNNPKLTAKAKERLVAELNKKIAELEKNRPKIIKLDLAIFEKTLETIKKSNYLNQAGYGIIKSDLEYLKNNL